MTSAARPPFYQHTLELLGVAALLLAAACSEDCMRSTGTPVWSPNGEWMVQAKRSLCDGPVIAIGTDSLVVELSQHKPTYPDRPVVVLSGSGPGEDDVQLRWTSNDQLAMTVPAHTDIDTLMASVGAIQISLGFAGAPADRAKWVAYRRALSEWSEQLIAWDRRRQKDPAGAGPPPKMPQLEP